MKKVKRVKRIKTVKKKVSGSDLKELAKMGFPEEKPINERIDEAMKALAVKKYIVMFEDTPGKVTSIIMGFTPFEVIGWLTVNQFKRIKESID